MIDTRSIFNFLGITRLNDRCGSDDDRTDHQVIKDNGRSFVEAQNFFQALSRGDAATARQLAKRYDWEPDEISDAMAHWLREG